MPQPSTATPGSSSQLASRHGQTAGKSAWIATGSNWNPAPMAVTVSTPSVIRWRPATGRPRPAAGGGEERRSGRQSGPAGQMEHQGGRQEPERDRGRQQPAAAGGDHDGSRASLMRTSPSRCSTDRHDQPRSASMG